MARAKSGSAPVARGPGSARKSGTAAGARSQVTRASRSARPEFSAYSRTANRRRPSASSLSAKSKTARRRRKKSPGFIIEEVLRDAGIIILGAAFLFLFLSIYLPPLTGGEASLGSWGAAVDEFVKYQIGAAAFLVPLYLFILWGWLSYPDPGRTWHAAAGWGAAVLVLAFLALGLFDGAGESGYLLTGMMLDLLGAFYPILVCVLILLAGVVAYGRGVVRPTAEIAGAGARGIGSAIKYIGSSIALAIAPPQVDEEEEYEDEATLRWEDDAEELDDEPREITISAGPPDEEASESENEESDEESFDEEEAGSRDEITIGVYEETNGELEGDDELQYGVDRETGQVEFRFKSELPPYELPPLSLLRDAPFTKNDRADLLAKAEIIERTLTDFKIDAKVNHIQEGPRVTRFEIAIGPGINVSKIHNLSENLALELAVVAVRIESPVPGKSAVGIEVPNQNFQLVTLKSILESPECKNARGLCTIGLGRDISGKPIVGNLAKMPHTLVAGATGSGKSVCLNTIIMSLLYRATPDELKMVMIDPKWVELTVYKDLPHLITPVVHTKAEIIGTLGWIIKEMERRYRLLQRYTAKNIASYNAMVEGEERLPYIIVIVDELADLFMIAGKVAEKQITRIAQKARAVGIHLVVATQRPDVKVITGTIKANIPSRIAFAVAQQVDSRTILDMNGAEKLLGEGDMLYSPIGAMKPARVQGAFVSDEEIAATVEFICAQRKPEFNPEIARMIRPEDDEDEFGDGGGENDGESSDELYHEAKEIVLSERKCSISYLQRRLRIGYQRSARIVDALVAAGIVEEDPETGSYRVPM
ncbi:MAG: DNA translocase FtsK [bacterium]|jgi:S-DNA-T family DNA segregation ATPase FtsK/SpoIIIE